MSERELLHQERDQALADLVDLQRQVAAGEIPDEVAGNLRRRYETTAARAIDALDEQPAAGPQRVPPGQGRTGGGPARIVAYLAAAATIVAALVLVPQHVAERPDGGFVSGNEAASPPAVSAQSVPAVPRELSKVTNAEMEAVIAANPDVLGMQLALAGRYLEQARYDKATEHYGVALKQAPNDPVVRAGAAWLLFKTGDTDAALRFVDETLTRTPNSPDAQWYKAKILLDGRGDPHGALDVLRGLAARGDLPAERREEIARLMTRARQAAGR